MANANEGKGTAGAAPAGAGTAAPPPPPPPPRDTVTCTIDGVTVTVPKGTRIIEAAEIAGIGISHYCYHPGLSAPAMCRQCLVEIQGVPKLQPACVTPVADGNVILTES